MEYRRESMPLSLFETPLVVNEAQTRLSCRKLLAPCYSFELALNAYVCYLFLTGHEATKI